MRKFILKWAGEGRYRKGKYGCPTAGWPVSIEDATPLNKIDLSVIFEAYFRSTKSRSFTITEGKE